MQSSVRYTHEALGPTITGGRAVEMCSSRNVVESIAYQRKKAFEEMTEVLV
jgi:hypothetical protein